MARTYKNIRFFQLQMYRLANKQNSADEQEYLSTDQRREILKKLIETRLNENNAMRVEKRSDYKDADDYAILEILFHDSDYVFGRIGKEKDMASYHFRDKKTLSPHPIIQHPDRYLEAFSYFLIDCSNFSVSYLQEAAAPSIVFLGQAISKVNSGKEMVWGQISALIAEDALPYIAGKDIIGTISFAMTLPLGSAREITGLSEKEYELLLNQGSMEVQVKFKADKRNTSVFGGQTKAFDFLKKLSIGKDKVKVSAKDIEDPVKQDFTLTNNPLAKRADFTFSHDPMSNDELQEEIKNRLIATYTSNKEDVAKYIGLNKK